MSRPQPDMFGNDLTQTDSFGTPRKDKAEPVARQPVNTCEWSFDGETWHTACGQDLTYADPSGGPTDAREKFCGYCAKPLTAAMRKRTKKAAKEKEKAEACSSCCAYCGYESVAANDGKVLEVLKAHIEQCPKHPMAGLRKEVDSLTADRTTMLVQLSNVRSILGLKDGPVDTQIKSADLSFRSGVAAERKRIRERVGHISHESEMPDWVMAVEAVLAVIEEARP